MTDGARSGTRLSNGDALRVYSGASDQNTALTISTPTSRPGRALFVSVTYSATPVQTGVTITLKSALGAAYDNVIHTGTENVRYTLFTVDGDWLTYSAGDTIDVTAPAGGGVITSAIAIYTIVL